MDFVATAGPRAKSDDGRGAESGSWCFREGGRAPSALALAFDLAFDLALEPAPRERLFFAAAPGGTSLHSV